MPVMSCQDQGRPGYKWGQSGKCYTYTRGSEMSKRRAQRRAARQGAAVRATGWREKGK